MKLGHPAPHPAETFGLASIPLSVLLGVLRSMGERLHEGIYVLDSQDRLQYANPAAQRLLGVQRESQILGREIAPLCRRLGDEVDDRRYGVLDDDGTPAAILGVMVRVGARPPAPRRRTLGDESRLRRFEVCDVDELDIDGEAVGCVVVRVVSDAPAAEVEPVVRDLEHLISRVTRPEDMVVRVDGESVALFAHVDTLAGVKALAERITARGRREIREEFRVGIALGGPGDTAATLVRGARTDDYTTKPRMRGLVALSRSGAV